MTYTPNREKVGGRGNKECLVKRRVYQSKCVYILLFVYTYPYPFTVFVYRALLEDELPMARR